MPVKVEKEGPLVVTFRSHHNAYREGDGSGAKIIYYPEPDSVLYRIAQDVFGLIIIHYFLWFIPMFLLVYIPYQWGYGWISLMLSGIYLPTYFNKDELNYGRPWEWIRENKLWRLLHHYGQVEIVRESGELDPNRKYIFGYHPHGILILSRITTYGGIWYKLFPGIEQRCLGATPMFNHPGSREICLWMGAVRADRSNALRILSTDKLNLVLYPGGSDEIFLTNPQSKENIILARKGFIRLALQTGADLVPSFVFGEKHAYSKWEIPQSIKSFFMKKLRLPLIVFWGRYFTWLPLRKKDHFLSVVYGHPIRIEKAIEDPTDEEIDVLYDKFYKEIRNLFEKYKGKYGYDEDETLVIKEAKSKAKENKTANGCEENKNYMNGTPYTNRTSNGITNGNGYHS